MDNVETKKTFNNKQVISILGAAVFTTFSLTTIYNKFVFNDEEIQLNKQKIEKVKQDINARLDKKTARNQEAIDDNLKALKELQKSESDKE